MRIAILYWSRRKVGGTEAYLESIISELVNAGHQVAFWSEEEGPRANERINLPEGVPSWCVQELGVKSALIALRQWSPEILYTHCLMNLRLEAETFKIAPAIFFAHAYYGTCISGNKSFRRPISVPCHRRFGWQCMVNYYPRRCGGLSPMTMVREYRRQSRRLEQLKSYKAIVTHSEYMRDEYIKHGFDPARVHCLSYYANRETNPSCQDVENRHMAESRVWPSESPIDASSSHSNGPPPDSWRLLFLGRMTRLKGGEVLMDALPLVRRALGQNLHVTFAGDGRMRKRWQRYATRITARTPDLEFHFTGWVDRNKRESLWRNCDLLVVPSVWPEPFGLVGPEAGLHAVPIAAFDVGGISDWLSDGVNGFLAPGDPPTPEGLAEAISRCLSNRETYQRLQRGATAMAQRFNVQNHLSGLLRTFEEVLTY
jgi:glycosyltransferase involved in cell wall biosynthesis